MTDHNRTPEQQARTAIDTKLEQAGWRVQSKGKIDFGAGTGVAVREYPTDVGPADYALFIDGRAVGVIEAKRDEWGHKITAVEQQSGAYTRTPNAFCFWSKSTSRVNNINAREVQSLVVPLCSVNEQRQITRKAMRRRTGKREKTKVPA